MPVGKQGAHLWHVTWREGRQAYAQCMQADTPGEIRHLFNLSAARQGARIVSVIRVPAQIVGIDIGAPAARAEQAGAVHGNAD